LILSEQESMEKIVDAFKPLDKIEGEFQRLKDQVFI